MKKESKSNTSNQQQSQPPRFDAAISEAKLNQTLANWESWDGVRLTMLAPLAKDSATLLQEYQSEASGVSDEFVATTNILFDYRDHLAQCLYMLSAALERVALVGEYLAKDVKEEQRQPIPSTFHETIH